MTETTLRVQLREIKTVRLVCRQAGCGGVVEIPVGKLASVAENAVRCPACQTQFVKDTSNDPLVALGHAIERTNQLDKSFDLEFPVRVDAPPASAK